jgi:hypothetical protein
MLNRLFGAALLCLLAVPAFAADVRLTWVLPTQCEDGSPIANCPITGIEVSESAAPSGQPWGVRETVSGTSTSRTYQIPPGQRCFSVKAISGNQKSEASTVACADVPALPPKAPTGITVTVQVTVATP